MCAKIFLSKPSKDISMRFALQDDTIPKFESLLEEYLNTNGKVALLHSGTAAIHLALILSGVSENDIVICQSATFVASVNPIRYQNAKPVFVGSENTTGNMCPIALEQAIQDCLERGTVPKAIIVAHLYGMPAQIDTIASIAKKYNIILIEDAAEALGASYKGQQCGTFGDFGILSFNTNKILTTFGGGALICKDDATKQKAVFLASQAKEKAMHYQHEVVGYNYSMSEVTAGIGCEQMHFLENNITATQLHHAFYKALFSEIPGIQVLEVPSKNYTATFWLSCILIDSNITGFSRDDVYYYLEENNIESRPLWKPMHLQPVFKHYPFYGTHRAAHLFENGLCLPSGANLTPTEKHTIAKTIRDFIIGNHIAKEKLTLSIPVQTEKERDPLDVFLQHAQHQQFRFSNTTRKQQLFAVKNIHLENEINSKVILITGAAGSIGSELSRQLAAYQYKRLILVDQAESSLYDLQQDLVLSGVANFEILVADIRDSQQIESIFERYTPQIVFHAAAYKHVPLMEQRPNEAIATNVLGTKNVVDLSVKYDAERFVLISSDKAVNPTNVMGATKRAAEMYVSSLNAASSKTKCITTRFGNVIGSNGSVVPLFQKQIAKGGPILLTHKEVTRYFMPLSEACSLLLQAGCMGEGGEIYIFDMGKSIKVFDMAKRMISLSGLKYPDDIDIIITGLRPGEKLHEEVLADGENTKPTQHPKILIANTARVASDLVFKMVLKLSNTLQNNDYLASVLQLKLLVPEYKSQNSEFERLD